MPITFCNINDGLSSLGKPCGKSIVQDELCKFHNEKLNELIKDAKHQIKLLYSLSKIEQKIFSAVLYEDLKMIEKIYKSRKDINNLITKVKIIETKFNPGTNYLKFKKLNENAFTPTKGSEKAAGHDLKSAYDYIVPKHGKEIIDTAIKIELPPNSYGRIAPRSGLAANYSIDVGGGVIDEDYRGPIKIILFNFSDEDFKINKGDRIAQIICQPVIYPETKEIKEVSFTERGDKGFGSSGTK